MTSYLFGYRLKSSLDICPNLYRGKTTLHVYFSQLSELSSIIYCLLFLFCILFIVSTQIAASRRKNLKSYLFGYRLKSSLDICPNLYRGKTTLIMQVFKQKQTHINIISFLLFCILFIVSTQIAASRRKNLKSDVWKLWLEIAIWSLSHKGKLDFNIHVECARFACSLVFLHDFSMSSQNVQYGKNVILFFISLPFA
jgi:uncharacterized membrane protein YtjA (UPF0391 family)